MMSPAREIPFFNYQALYRSQQTEILDVLTDVMERGAYILQQDLADFEQNLKDFLGVKHAFGVGDGTNALLLSLYAVGLQRGDEVIIPSHTYIATAAAVHFAGGTPVLVECGADNMVDPGAIESAVTDKTAVIMPVQLNGRTADMDAISAIAEKHGLTVVEDAAQALGSKFRGQSAGTFGAAGTFSFYPAKVLGCFGDGGAIVSNDDAVASRVSLLRDHGRDENGEVVAWGTNSRLDNMQAAVLNLKLKTFTQDIERRRQIASMYQEGLSNIESLSLPPGPDSDERHFDVYQNYELEADKRDELKQHLESRGVRTIIQWNGKAVHQFNGLGFEDVSLPITEEKFRRFLMLPMNTSLTDEDVHYVIEQITDFYGN
jgi:dTDP-4-amino-4,6-dideoxygalactose transaminase